MNQADFDAWVTTANFTPDAGQTRTFVVDETASGDEEVFDKWGGGPQQGWLLLRSRYGETQPDLVRAVRASLVRGARCVITTADAEIAPSGFVVDGTLVFGEKAMRRAAFAQLDVLRAREIEAIETAERLAAQAEEDARIFRETGQVPGEP